MSAFHHVWGYIAAAISGVVGIWGVAMAKRDVVPRPFYWAVGFAVVCLLAQVGVGVVLLQDDTAAPGDQHVFYGVLIAVTFSFAYIYRAQFRKRPALHYGLLLLFTMGLGIRAIMTFGVDF